LQSGRQNFFQPGKPDLALAEKGAGKQTHVTGTKSVEQTKSLLQTESVAYLVAWP
jgi:hypothetical protein